MSYFFCSEVAVREVAFDFDARFFAAGFSFEASTFTLGDFANTFIGAFFLDLLTGFAFSVAAAGLTVFLVTGFVLARLRSYAKKRTIRESKTPARVVMRMSVQVWTL